MIIQFWNALKSAWSRINDALMRGAARAPIPTFVSPEAVSAYLMARGLYTGDPWGGVLDFNLHPQRFQAAMMAGPEAVGRLAVDCDDYATWAHDALLTIPDCTPTIFTLRDGAGWGHHVVCGYRLGDRYGVIDTNGHRVLPDLTSATLCRVFTELYQARGYRYAAAVATRYPF